MIPRYHGSLMARWNNVGRFSVRFTHAATKVVFHPGLGRFLHRPFISHTPSQQQSERLYMVIVYAKMPRASWNFLGCLYAFFGESVSNVGKVHF